jgi:hypothetical protein
MRYIATSASAYLHRPLACAVSASGVHRTHEHRPGGRRPGVDGLRGERSELGCAFRCYIRRSEPMTACATHLHVASHVLRWSSNALQKSFSTICSGLCAPSALDVDASPCRGGRADVGLALPLPARVTPRLTCRSFPTVVRAGG